MSLCDIMCAFGAGVIGRVAVYPLDTIKVVGNVAETSSIKNGTSGGLASSNSKNTGNHLTREITSAARSILKSDGWRGMYRGLGISVVASGPGVALYMTSYDEAKKWLFGRREPNSTHSTVSHMAEHLFCGLTAEAVSCVVWVPQDVIKERLQSQHSDVQGRYKSSWHGFSTLYGQEGLRGMYKGYFSTLGSFGPFSAVYFASFEETQILVKNSGLFAENTRYPGFQTALAAGLANIFACVLLNPLEVAKTRYQVQRAVLEDGEVSKQFKGKSSSMIDALKQGVKHEGLISFWRRGLLARILFQTPSSAITFGLAGMFKSNFCDTPKTKTSPEKEGAK